MLAIDGINKNSVVIGPFLIAIGVAWFLHDRYGTTGAASFPCMLVLLGALMLVARSPRVPERRSSAVTRAERVLSKRDARDDRLPPLGIGVNFGRR